MSKQKRFMIGAVLFYVYYVYMGAVYHFARLAEGDVLHKVLMITAPIVWIGMEFAASVLFILAPMLFFAVTVIINLLPAFTKAQKVVLTVLPITSYALLWAMDFIYSAYFSFWALH